MTILKYRETHQGSLSTRKNADQRVRHPLEDRDPHLLQGRAHEHIFWEIRGGFARSRIDSLDWNARVEGLEPLARGLPAQGIFFMQLAAKHIPKLSQHVRP